MFGLEVFGVSSAFLLCLLSAVLCVIYGIVNWNKGNENETDQIKEELAWQTEENQIDEKL